MSEKDLFKVFRQQPPGPGKLLVSEPFLPDPNFSRTVVLLTEHQDQGSVGFVLNRKLDVTLTDVIDLDTDLEIPLYLGGPVQQDTLHIIHQDPDMGNSELEIKSGVFWGANFEAVKLLIEQSSFEKEKFKFFLGYSGWGESQLQDELNNKSWIVTEATNNIIFHQKDTELWKLVLKELGGNFSFLANSPDNPQMN